MNYPSKITDEIKAQLGTMPDVDIAKIHGVSRMTVRVWREKLEIPAFLGRSKKRSPRIIVESQFVIDALKELEPIILQRYIEAGLPIDRLHTWQIIEIAVRDLLNSARREKTRAAYSGAKESEK